MPVPTGGMQEYRGSSVTLEANGGSIANGSLVEADDASYDTSSDGEACPDAEFVLAGAFPTAPTEATALSLYARPLDVDGTGDTEVPEATRPTVFIGNFIVNNVTSTQYLQLIARSLPKLARYYVHNNSTGQTLSSGWTLKVRPYTLFPKA